ncbi:hypothetical protein NEHOM01_0044 [Nematocida homosporus]|uniref:uncharacterized protein n=1 Tax=Nematocida homosporus TaxID=1912981 RepID=UPI00221F8356|nr:uncharacterized protein NEHOM01_0044 [Nematocida homosporus]KAI5184299.1 hypothetical protein NEHOM01_0044 [Nematocida homosporus]
MKVLMESNNILDGKDRPGYAIAKDWYIKYKSGETNLPKLINRPIRSKITELTAQSDYQVISCSEWEKIRQTYNFDIEVPVGVVNISMRLQNKDTSPIDKHFQAAASQEIFEVIQVVLFSHKMTKSQFNQQYDYQITNGVDLSAQLIKCNSDEVNIEISLRDSLSNDLGLNDSLSGLKKRDKIGEVNTHNNLSRNNNLSYQDNKNSKDLKKDSGTKPVEFRNVGLSCYMNTALQVLLGVSELSQKILGIRSETIRELSQRKNTKKGYSKEKSAQLLLAYRGLAKSAAKGEDCSGRLREMKRALGNIDPRYGRCTEEDAGEVFSLILTNFSYLFERTAYEKLVSNLFMYNADLVRVYKTESGQEVHRERKNLYKSFVLNGSFGSEKGPHAHVLVVHQCQLLITSLCVYQESSGELLVGAVKEKISRDFQVPVEQVLVGEMAGEGRMVLKREDSYRFMPKKALFGQPIFYIAEQIMTSEIEFVFLKYLPQKENQNFFTSLFGNNDKNIIEMPFIMKKERDIAEFFKSNLKIIRKPEESDTLLEIKDTVAESPMYFSSMVVVISHKHWQATEYIESLKERKNKAKETLHVQCVLTNWENNHVRQVDRKKDRNEKKEPIAGAASVLEFTSFCCFAKYFCVQLPLGLGSYYTGERLFEKHKLQVEKDGLILDGKAYSLVGILVHHNFGIGGHYVAFTKRGDVWYHCNDSTITKSSVQEAVSTGYPYGILYRVQE